MTVSILCQGKTKFKITFSIHLIHKFFLRFVRELNDDGKEILSMNEVLKYLLKSYQPVISPEQLGPMTSMTPQEWVDFVETLQGMIVTHPGKKPAGLRIDQLDREQMEDNVINYPQIVHFGTRPPQICYAGNTDYQKAWRNFTKYRYDCTITNDCLNMERLSQL